MPSLLHSDAYILMEFRDAVKPLMGKPLTQEHKLAIGKVAAPYFKRLCASGNTARDAAWLLQAVYEDKRYA